MFGCECLLTVPSVQQTNIGRLAIWNNTKITSVPSELGLLSNSLTSLSLGKNDLLMSGIPTEWYRLTLLDTLFIDTNARAASTISSEIALFTSLTTLGIQLSAFSGSISTLVSYLACCCVVVVFFHVILSSLLQSLDLIFIPMIFREIFLSCKTWMRCDLFDCPATVLSVKCPSRFRRRRLELVK